MVFSTGLLHCAKRDDSISVFNLNSQAPSEHNTQCNPFSDETFHGEAKAVFSASGQYDPSCVQVEIFKGPSSLFEVDNLFLQAYPIRFNRGEFNSGLALNIEIYQPLQKKPLLVSELLDAQIIKKLDSSTSNEFFRKHYFKLCSEDLGQYRAVQLVVYFEDKEKETDKNSVVRTTRFLLPPFLSHPTHFKKSEGKALAALHPFLTSKKKEELGSEHFYQLANSICE